jgi:dTDP-4-amino-4,6-dideoxygalactose transaminase
MTAFLLDIKDGDEVIMPSFTFTSSANAFVCRGASIVFVDIEPKTMNLDVTKIESAITKYTRAIVPVHYAGVSCDMDAISAIVAKKKIAIVEDAAQGFMSKYKGNMLGSLGLLGCYSFHETKNISCGEGGLLLINDESYIERAEIIREKGTNRGRFIRGMVDKYTWVDKGSSYLPSDLNAAFLFAQLENAQIIQNDRMNTWNHYKAGLEHLEKQEILELPYIPEHIEHNAHMFYIKASDINERSALIDYLKNYGIGSAFHYIPLHSSEAGRRFGRFSGRDESTTKESERLLRLPLWYGISLKDIEQIIEIIIKFYKG